MSTKSRRAIMPNIKQSKTTGKFISHVKQIEKVCENCDTHFQMRPLSLKYGSGKCCSKKCMDELRQRMNTHNCPICKTPTTNKIYCGEPCQYEGYRRTATKVELICLYCNGVFSVRKAYFKLHPEKKYCSRICKDTHQKGLYSGENNPMYGKPLTGSHIQKIIDGNAKSWIGQAGEIRRKNQKDSIELFKQKNGYYPGTDSKSVQKRKETNLKRYGAEYAGMNIPELKERTEKTCMELYGKLPIEMWQDGLRNTVISRLELKLHEILRSLNIKFTPHFKLVGCGKYRYFDVWLDDLNILIEADGDFWHANPNFYDKNKLLECQLRSLKNDDLKNKMAKHANIKLLRFWENEVYAPDFPEKLTRMIYEKN